LVGLVHVAAPAAAELRHQGGALESEEARCGLLVALGAAQGLLDQAVLELLDRAVEIEAVLAERGSRNLLLGDEGADAGRQVLDRDVAVLGEDDQALEQVLDRKSTRLNSSHGSIS